MPWAGLSHRPGRRGRACLLVIVGAACSTGRARPGFGVLQVGTVEGPEELAGGLGCSDPSCQPPTWEWGRSSVAPVCDAWFCKFRHETQLSPDVPPTLVSGHPIPHPP